MQSPLLSLTFLSSTGIVLTEREKKTFLRVRLKLSGQRGHEIVFLFFLTVCPPVYLWLISDKLMGSRTFGTMKFGQRSLCNLKRKNTSDGKGNMVSKTNISVTEHIRKQTAVLDDDVEQEQIICSKHFWNIISMSHEIFDCSLISSFIRYSLSTV